MVGWYMYTQDIHEGVEIVYELPLLLNNAVSGTFLHNSGTVQRVDYIFILGALTWW
jgi:hypothetical protein